MAITIGCGIQMPNYFQGINISHLGKRKIIFKIPFLGDMLVPWRITTSRKIKTYGCEQKLNFPGLPMQKYANMFFFSCPWPLPFFRWPMSKENSEPYRSMASTLTLVHCIECFVSSRHFETTQPYPCSSKINIPTSFLQFSRTNLCVQNDPEIVTSFYDVQNFGDQFNVVLWNLFFLDVVGGRG